MIYFKNFNSNNKKNKRKIIIIIIIIKLIIIINYNKIRKVRKKMRINYSRRIINKTSFLIKKRRWKLIKILKI